MSLVIAHDAIHVNIGHLPAGQAAGYTTGSPDIRWTPQDWADHPGAVRIDQDMAASDGTADVLDVESGAATFADCPAWAKRALANYVTGVRAGMRMPAIYMSASNVSSVVNALLHGGIRSGVGLWVANWSVGESGADNLVLDGSGPFPVIGVQFSSGPYYDTDIFSAHWLGSTKGVPLPPPGPPTLAAGATGPWVHAAQLDLNRNGASPALTPDGVFGPLTKAAVISFQRKSGLVPDGVIGALTWKELQS